MDILHKAVPSLWRAEAKISIALVNGETSEVATNAQLLDPRCQGQQLGALVMAGEWWLTMNSWWLRVANKDEWLLSC